MISHLSKISPEVSKWIDSVQMISLKFSIERNTIGKSFEDISKDTGLDVEYLKRIFNGKCIDLNLQEISIIADSLGKNISDFITVNKINYDNKRTSNKYD